MKIKKHTYNSFILLINLFLVGNSVLSQNNAGIGTTTPHPSALLDVTDSSRGVLITQTDTASIKDYVDNLTPASPIADGLLIYEVNEKTYMYYDATLDKWRRLIDLVGPDGKRGERGPVGPVGPKGRETDWRDSSNAIPVLLPRDKCGDYYFNNITGTIWKVKCDSAYMNPQWVDTLSADNYIGIMKSPEEVVYAETLESFSNQNESPSGGGSILTDDISFVDIQGLNYTFELYLDEVAYVYAFAHGTTSFSFGSNDYGYAQYDLALNGGGALVLEDSYQGKFFFDKDNASNGNLGNIVTLSKNGPPSFGQTFGLFDQVGWSAHGSWIVQGPLTPAPPCMEKCGQTGCPPCPAGSYFVNIKTQGGARVSNSNVDIKIADDASPLANKRNKAFMTVFLIRRRSPNAVDYRK